MMHLRRCASRRRRQYDTPRIAATDAEPDERQPPLAIFYAAISIIAGERQLER